MTNYRRQQLNKSVLYAFIDALAKTKERTKITGKVFRAIKSNTKGV